MNPSRNPYRLTLLASALLSSLAAAPAFAGGAVAGADTAALAVIDDTGSGASLGVGEDLYLEVVLNQQPTGSLARFGERDGQLWASAATLRQLGFVLPAGTPDPVRLSALPGVTATYDEAHQLALIDAPLSLLDLQTTVLNQANTHAVPKAGASPGVLLNYDLHGTIGQHGQDSFGAYSELRAFGGAGVFSTTSLAQMTRTHGQGRDMRSVRLDSSWQTSFPASMLTLTVGDTLTGSLAWSRATHIAGVQLSRDFALQPYRITTPVPAFLGQATVPSAVDLYIDGVKQYSGEVQPGPFRLDSVPTISGNGNAQVVLTDAMGRSTTVDFPFYTTEQLLQKGLSDWSAEVGVVRQAYGQKSFDYGRDPAASGTWRYGASDRFTVQGHAEATSGLALAGIGGNLLVGYAGVLNASLAHSDGGHAGGTLYNLGYSWRHGPFNVSIDSTRTRGDYRDVASLYGVAPPRVSERALVGMGTAHAGSFSISYLHQEYAGDVASRYASAYWFRSFGRDLSLSFSVNQNLDDRRDRSLFLGISLNLDDRTMLGASVQRSGDRGSVSIDASRPISGDGGFGWRAQARSGDGQRGGLAEAGYRGSYGQVSAGISANAGNDQAYADAAGSLVLMGGHVFATRHIDDAFAVVSTDGIANVPVKLENRVVGNTDADGLLLVTPLNAWQDNQLGIDPMQLPADVRLGNVRTVATPTDRAGILVRFDIVPVHAASVILVDTDGAFLPLGAHVRIEGQKDAGALVGFDGAVYLDTLDTHNTLLVDTPQGPCRARFDYPMQGDAIPQIGPVACLTEASR